MNWLKFRKREIEKMCEACTKSYEEKKDCIFKHSVNFKQDYPCKYMEGKHAWRNGI